MKRPFFSNLPKLFKSFTLKLLNLNEIKNNSFTNNVAHGQQMYAMKSNGTTNDSFCCIILMNY